MKNGKQIVAKAIGKRVADARRDAGLTQQELATKVDMHASTIATWEQGREIPEPTSLQRIADALGEPLTYFYFFDIPGKAQDAGGRPKAPSARWSEGSTGAAAEPNPEPEALEDATPTQLPRKRRGRGADNSGHGPRSVNSEAA